MSSWDACTLEPNAVLRWIECHAGTAGWVQAFGAVAAIIAAFLISHLQTAAAVKQEARRRAASARAVAYLLLPSITQIIVNAERIRTTIETREHGMALLTPATSTIDNAVNAMTFKVSGDRDVLLRLDTFPPAIAATVVRLFSAVEDFDDLVSEYLPQARRFDGNQRGAFIEDVDRKFAGIERLMSEANAQMKSAFG